MAIAKKPVKTTKTTKSASKSTPVRAPKAARVSAARKKALEADKASNRVFALTLIFTLLCLVFLLFTLMR